MIIQKIYIGGWFQRTTLHLSEIYDFLKEGNSPLDLNKKKLKKLQKLLDIKSVDIQIDALEYIKIENKQGIIIKIYEDGLIVLSKSFGKTIKGDIEELRSYYEKKLSPGISYIFSLGAPIPKELANIKTIYPYFIVLDKANKGTIKKILNDFKEEKHFEIKEKTFEVYRGNKLYIINDIDEDIAEIEKFIQEQIFTREFKGQMHRYLNLHRIIWERIAKVKEKGAINGKEIGKFKNKIESYKKTINLIEARINQMGTYIRTREKIVKNNEKLKEFANVLQFKYETLSNTLSYIKEIWKMTKHYVDSATKLFSDLQAKSTESSIKNLAVITAMGVGGTLISLFTQKIPTFTWFGAGYFLALVFIGYMTNKIMKEIYINRMYKIKDTKAAKDIK